MTQRVRNLSMGEYFRRKYDRTPRPLAFDASTPEEFEAWKSEFQGVVTRCLEPFPDPVDPNPEVVEVVDENMANAARVHAIERGKVIGRHTMVAFGGGAPLHAGRLARKLGIDRVVIPTGAGVGSAIGFLLAPIAYEVVRTLQVDFRDFDAGAINTMLDEMQAEATDVVRGGALSDAALIATRIVELRYAGQGHDLRIRLDDGPLTRDHGAALKARFEARYRDVYGLTIDGLDIQSVSWSVTVSTEAPPAARASEPALRSAPSSSARQSRRIYDAELGKVLNCPVYTRFELAPGMEIAGPAVIAEDETSTYVPAGFSAALNSFEYIVMERSTARAVS